MSGEKAPEKLARLQAGFAAHIRDPENVPAPEGIEDRRMDVYRDLFFNNIRNFLSANFPVLKSLYSGEEWTRLCRDFYSEFRCHTPLFTEIPREFLKYLQDSRSGNQADPPFMLELAHYEWVELALTLDEAEPGDLDVDPDGDLLNQAPVLSPLAWPLSYQFPVHRIRADYQPDTAPPSATHLLVWRTADYQVRFMQLNEFSWLLLQRMKDHPAEKGLQLLKSVAEISNHPKPGTVIKYGEELMFDLRDKGIILGTRS